MTAPLTVHNAEITTTSVEIKTLTISGKQVTLAVFRQLRHEPLITKDGALRGEPWGTVNYHPTPKSCPDEPHWHVVWQKGSELRRDVVKVQIYSWLIEPGSEHRHKAVRDRIRQLPQLFIAV